MPLELRTGGFWALPDEDGGVWLQVPGFEETQAPGAPALPVMRPWLEAVAGRKVKLARVTGRDVVAFDGLRPVVTGEPELWQAEDGTLHTGRRRKRPGKAFKAAGLYPEAAAQLLGVAFQGDVKKGLRLGAFPQPLGRGGGLPRGACGEDVRSRLGALLRERGGGAEPLRPAGGPRAVGGGGRGGDARTERSPLRRCGALRRATPSR